MLLALREPAALPAGAIAAAAREVDCWGRVLATAAVHRVGGFLAAALEREACWPPGGLRGALDRLVSDQARPVGPALAGLEVIAAAFARENLPLLVLKGPALAATLYPAPELRPFDDLDLCVPTSAGPAAAALLLRLGYLEEPYPAESARADRDPAGLEGAAFHRQFSSPDGRVLVDLHADPYQLGLRPRAEADLWRRARPLPGRRRLLMLAPTDQVVQLAVHAHKHGFSRLLWLKDLDLLVRRLGAEIDWRLVASGALADGVAASVWYALRLSRVLLGAPLPIEVERLAPAPPLRWLYRRVWPLAEIAGRRGRMRRRAVQLHLAESWRGVLPSLVFMGRRRERLQALGRVLARRADPA